VSLDLLYVCTELLPTSTLACTIDNFRRGFLKPLEIPSPLGVPVVLITLRNDFTVCFPVAH